MLSIPPWWLPRLLGSLNLTVFRYLVFLNRICKVLPLSWELGLLSAFLCSGVALLTPLCECVNSVILKTWAATPTFSIESLQQKSKKVKGFHSGQEMNKRREIWPAPARDKALWVRSLSSLKFIKKWSFKKKILLLKKRKWGSERGTGLLDSSLISPCRACLFLPLVHNLIATQDNHQSEVETLS